MLGPNNAIRPQGVRQAHHVQQVPAAAFILPFATIGVDQVAPKQKAGKFIIEADAVVAHANGAGLRQFGMNTLGKRLLCHPALQALLRRDARNQAGGRVGQIVGRGLAQQIDGFAHDVELRIGADGGKLRGAVAARVDAESFVIVPKEGMCHAAIISLPIQPPRQDPGIQPPNPPPMRHNAPTDCAGRQN